MDNKSLDTKKEPDFYIGISRDEAKIISIGKTVDGMKEIEIDLNDENNQEVFKLEKRINSIMKPELVSEDAAHESETALSDAPAPVSEDAAPESETALSDAPAPVSEDAAPESETALSDAPAPVSEDNVHESSNTLVSDKAYVRFNNALKSNRNISMSNRPPSPEAVGNVLKNSKNVLESAVVTTIGGAKHKRTKRRKSKRRKTKRRKTKRSK